MNAAAGGDEDVDGLLGADVAGVGLVDGRGSEEGGGGHCVLGVEPARLGGTEQGVHVVGPEHFAPGGFGRLAVKKVSTQEVGEQVVVGRAGSGVLAVRVVRGVEEAGGEFVDHHVGRARVEGAHVGRGAAGGEDGEVGDAAEVEEAAILGVGRAGDVIEVRDEGGALAAPGEVGRAEVADDRHAEPVGEGGGASDLEGGPHVPACAVGGLG